jgi:hypothetical protein
MTENISWVQASLSDSAISRLITRLSKKKRIETGGCGCGCGDSVSSESQKDAGLKQG